MNDEVWKPIKGFEGLYEISKFGIVKSLKRKIYLSSGINNQGYDLVTLQKNGYKKTMSIHRLVAQAFIPNPEKKPQVNHKNGIKIDNWVGNLEWNTSKENVNHSYFNGLGIGKRGEDSHLSKLTKIEVLKIRKLYNSGDYFQKELAEMFNVSRTNISLIINNKRWNYV